MIDSHLTLDMTNIGYGRTDVLLEAVNKATGIPKENIVINCSHTHNEPDESDSNIKEPPSFEAELASHVNGAVRNAVDSLQLPIGYLRGGAGENAGYVATKKDYDLGLAEDHEASLKHRLPPRSVCRRINSGRHHLSLVRVEI